MVEQGLIVRAVVLFALVLSFGSLGCAPASTPSSGDISGTILDLQRVPADQASDVIGTLLVEAVSEVGPSTVDKAFIKVTNTTSISDQTQAGASSIGFDALEVGQQVQVSFVGPVAESYPVQATAGAIVIVRR